MDFISEENVLAVKKGAAWMDENHHGWANKIDLSKLDMNNCHTCVIGQAVGNYFDEVYKIDIEDGYCDIEDWAVEYGFNASEYDRTDEEQMDEFRQLETLWTDEVRKRLG